MAAQVADLVSPAYAAQIRGLHARQGWGGAGKSHAPDVAAYVAELGARSILDYGCGRGTLAQALCDDDVREYDPGVAGKDALPAPADLVVCTDVLEHIEPERLGAVLGHIGSLARLGVYLVIGLGPARETLPDGRNAHLIQRPPEWWLDTLRARAGWTVERQARRKGLHAWIRT